MQLLVVEHRSNIVAEIPLEPGLISIGRDASNSLVIQSNACSPFHATIEGDEHGRAIVDRGSTGGTYVNGRRIKHAPIATGARITIGDHTLEIRDAPEIDPRAVADGAPAESVTTQSDGREHPPDTGPVRIALRGTLDAQSSNYLESSLRATHPQGTGLILDFAEVPSVNGDGWRLLIRRIRSLHNPGPIQCAHLNPAVLKGFRALGLQRFFSLSA
jgi:anti-anti-sigma regulatory factor